MHHLIFLTLFFGTYSQLAAKSFLPPSFRADYEQTIVKKISGNLKKAHGKIEYLHPGNIRFEQTRPEKVVWVSNPKKTWFYQAPFIKEEPGNLRITPTGTDSPSKIFDLLKDGLKDNTSYNVKKVKGSVELIFKDPKLSSNFQKAILTFKGKPTFKNLHSIKMIEQNGDPLELVFKSIDTEIRFKPKHFIFRAPANTRIE